MAYVDWKVHGDETLAAYLPDREFRGLLERRIAVAPDHAAILIRDGRIVDTYLGAHFSVGGVWQRMKEAVGGKHSLRLLVADLKPFPIRVGLRGHTKDHVVVRAELAAELQLNPEKPQDIMGLVENGRSLTKPDVFQRIRPHLQERVVLHELVQHDHDHLRANRGLQDRLQADIMREVERVAGDLGLLVRAVSVNWALTKEEAQRIGMRDRERQDELRDFQFARARREVERQAENTTFRIRSDLEVEKVKAATEADLERFLADQALAFEDAREEAERAKEMKRLLHGLELAKTERVALYDERLGDERNELERKRIELDRGRLETEFEALRARQEIEIRKFGQVSELEVAGAAHDLQKRKLEDLQEIELRKREEEHGLEKDEFLSRHSADMARAELESRTELEKLKIQAGMDPDQLLALQAGLSAEVARVFTERARAEGADGERREALLREMVELSRTSKAESEEQARAMFDKAVESLARAATAPRGGESPGPGPGAPAEGAAGSVECPRCSRSLPATDRFCRNCGYQLRS